MKQREKRPEENKGELEGTQCEGMGTCSNKIRAGLNCTQHLDEDLQPVLREEVDPIAVAAL